MTDPGEPQLAPEDDFEPNPRHADSEWLAAFLGVPGRDGVSFVIACEFCGFWEQGA